MDAINLYACTCMYAARTCKHALRVYVGGNLLTYTSIIKKA